MPAAGCPTCRCVHPCARFHIAYTHIKPRVCTLECMHKHARAPAAHLARTSLRFCSENSCPPIRLVPASTRTNATFSGALPSRGSLAHSNRCAAALVCVRVPLLPNYTRLAALVHGAKHTGGAVLAQQGGFGFATCRECRGRLIECAAAPPTASSWLRPLIGARMGRFCGDQAPVCGIAKARCGLNREHGGRAVVCEHGGSRSRTGTLTRLISRLESKHGKE